MWEIKTNSLEERKQLMRSLFLSVIILAIGLGWAGFVGYKNLPLRHALGHASDDLEALSKAAKLPKGADK